MSYPPKLSLNGRAVSRLDCDEDGCPDEPCVECELCGSMEAPDDCEMRNGELVCERCLRTLEQVAELAS